MSTYWCFDLQKVIAHIHYYEHIKDTNSMHELSGQMHAYRNGLKQKRENRRLPI
jgi:hypothetical protein